MTVKQYYEVNISLDDENTKNETTKFTKFSDAIKYAYDNSYGKEDLWDTDVSNNLKNGDHGSEPSDDLCFFDSPTSLVVGDYVLIIDLPEPNNKKMGLVKGKRITDSQKTEKKRLQKKESLNLLQTADDVGFQYDAHIVDFDENGNKQETIKSFTSKYTAFETSINYFFYNYDFDPEKYVSYEVYNVVEENNFKDFLYSFDIGVIFNLAGC